MRIKLFLSILLALFCRSAFLANAQEATDLDLQTARTEQKARAAAPSPAAIASDSAGTSGANVPELSQIDEAFKQTSLGKEADDLRLHAEWRKLSNQVANEPGIVAAKKAAEAARTDLEKRERLRMYYNLYYDQMRALASTPEMKAAVDSLKTGHLSSLNQPRVRPSPSASPQVVH